MIRAYAEEDEVDARSLTAHLANHGIKVETDVLQIRTTEEHKSLRKQIEQGHYDLLVMGGYSHPIWLLYSAVLLDPFSCRQKSQSLFRTKENVKCM